MAPKKKQQQQQKTNIRKPQSTSNSSSSSTAGPKVQISAQNEQRLRRLLLNNNNNNNSSDTCTVRPTFEESNSNSLSKAQKAKKLKAVYEKLSCEGFSDHHIERALSSLKDAATFEVALDWLCLNLSRTELPLKFRGGLSLHTGGSINVLSTAQENWTPTFDATVRFEHEMGEYSVLTKGRRDDDSLAVHEPSQANWIRQYMEKEEEMESETWEDMLSDEDSCKKDAEPRSYDTIVKEYQSARFEATAAKEKGDKQRQDAASNRIRMLKQELSCLGEYDLHLSDIVNMEASCSLYEEGNASSEAMDSSLIDKVEMEHSFSDDLAVHSITVNDAAASQEELDDTELGSFFMEDDSKNAALLPEVLMVQSKARSRGLPTSKDLEKLEGIWKKGDSPRIPKAVLHQLCQRSGWDPPKFDKVGKSRSGFNYSVSVLRKTTGRGKNRKAGGLITLQLPGQDEIFESAEEAQNRVATFALWRLFPDIPIQFLITEPYASLVIKWEEGESGSMIEDTIEDRRAGFVDSLLDAEPSVEISSVDVGDISNQNEVSQVFDERSPAVALQRDNSSKEKECFLLRQELENKQKTPRYKSMMEGRAALPIYKVKDEILQSLKQNDVVVVCGETGSGKTTQVPQYILDDMIVAGRGGHCNIVCTQPRRIAAISVAERVADERCEPGPGLDGSLVGYQVRLDSARNNRTKLLFCTTGILLRQIAGNKSFNGVTHVIVDEVHERSLLGDFLLIVLKNLLENQSALGTSTFKVILMSATVDSNLFSKYFGDCPVITAEGRTYPVSTSFLEDVYEDINYHLPSDSPACLGFQAFGHEVVGGSIDNRRGKKNLVLSSMGDETLLSEECMNPQYNPSAYQSYSEQTQLNLKKLNEAVIDYDLLEDLVCHIDENCGDGAILVFLPGISEIYRLYDKLAASYRFGGESSEWLLPLHSSVAAADQKKVFQKSPNNMRKIIMATNIAETSLTIDDVVYVIDSGKHKEYRYDPRKKLSMMVEDWISQANAKQRRGRAGRVKPGTCFCLYTRHRYENLMRPFQVPEMLRTPLVELCLQIKLLSLGDIKMFLSKALETPKDEAINSAISSLKEVGAVDENELLTPLGHHLAKLPVDLLLGKMMLYGAIFGCLSPILSIAAFLSHKSPFVQLKDEREYVERSKLALLSDKTDGSDNSWDNVRQSDHIIMMIAYKKWDKILREKGVKAAQNFCRLHSLSSAVMYTIRDMRGQLGTLLADIGLVHLPEDNQGRKKGNLDSWFSDASQPFNKHANDGAVVKAVLCAGLYPNVAATVQGIHAPALGNLRQSLKSLSKGSPVWYDGKREVHIHPSSVNGDSKHFQFPFLVFLEKVETNRVFLRDTTVISPYSLLLFGGAINVQHQLGLVTVDGWLKVAAPAQTAVLFKELRLTLQSVLNELIRKPQRAAVANEVVQSIIQLLLEETKPQA